MAADGSDMYFMGRAITYDLTPLLDRNNVVNALPALVKRIVVSLHASKGFKVRVRHIAEKLGAPAARKWKTRSRDQCEMRQKILAGSRATAGRNDDQTRFRLSPLQGIEILPADHRQLHRVCRIVVSDQNPDEILSIGSSGASKTKLHV